MATQNILFIKHEQFLKIMEERVQSEGMDDNIQQIMHDYLAQKRKTPWTINLEKIFILYINVSVAVDKTSVIRETLMQYRFLTQATYSSSLENVLIHIRNQVEALFKEKIGAFKIEEVRLCGDIESEELEQSLLTSYLQLDEKKREIKVKKILRQVMEMYRLVIETSKLHRKLEEVCSTTVERVLELCEKYNRVSELKRFLENQHLFLDQIQKREVDFSKNPNHINIFTAETRDSLIKMRLDCVEAALAMGFFSHAFAQLEDISILLNLRKVTTPVKMRMLSTYYLQLSKIFWNSRYYSYHSFFLYNHILVYRTNPSATTEEIRLLVDELLLGIMSIPPSSLESQQNEESRNKIAQLQKSSNKLIPKKEEIINIVIRMNLHELASPLVNELFNLMQNDINIFNIAKNVEPVFKVLRESAAFVKHIKPIEENLINRVLGSIAKVYKTLNLENLYKFLSFSAHDTCDSCLSYAAATNQISCRIDQSKKVIIFNPTKAKNDYVNASLNITALAQAAKIISAEITLERASAKSADVNAELVGRAQKFLEDSKEVLKIRADEVLRYKIKKEKANNQEKGKREFEDKLFEEKERLRKMEEHTRKLEEKRLREQVEATLLKQKMEIRTEIIKIKGNQVAKIEGVKIENMTEEDLRPIELDTMFELRKHIQDTLKENQESKYKKAFTKIDYIERETRKQEQEKIALLAAKDNQEKLDQYVVNAKVLFEQQLATKVQLSSAKDFKEGFFKTLLVQRQSEYESHIKEFKENVEKEFKQTIIEKATAAYAADQAKKREEEEFARKEQQQMLNDRMNNQQLESENADIGWRIVRENEGGAPSFDDREFGGRREEESSGNDFWRSSESTISRGATELPKDGPIARSAPGQNQFMNSNSSAAASEGFSRGQNNSLFTGREPDSDLWRSTATKVAVPKAPELPPRFQNSVRPMGAGGPSSIGQSNSFTSQTGNPNDGMRRGPPSFQNNNSNPSNYNNPNNNSTRPSFGFRGPPPTGNPNDAPAPSFQRNLAPRSIDNNTASQRPAANTNNSSSSNTGSAWRAN